MKHLSMIAAVGNNFEIGLHNQLLWHLPEDMRWFRNITSGHAVVMGRSTWESLAKKPLPNRRNIVMSGNTNLRLPDCEIAHSVEEVMEIIPHNEETFIIGGSSVFQLFMDKVEKLYLTRVFSDFEADTYFPAVDFTKWQLVKEQFFPKDEKNIFNLCFQCYQLKK